MSVPTMCEFERIFSEMEPEELIELLKCINVVMDTKCSRALEAGDIQKSACFRVAEGGITFAQNQIERAIRG